MLVPDPNASKTLPPQQDGQPSPEGRGQPGQGGSATPSPEGAGGNASSSGLSVDVIRQVVAEALSDYDRRQQSARDKLEARIQKQVQAQLSVLKQAGIDVTDDLRAKVETAVRSAPEPPASEEPSAAPGGDGEPAKMTPGDPVIEFINGQVAQMERDAGLSLDENDPEAAQVDLKAPPYRFLTQYQSALAAKKARLAAEESSSNPPGAALPQMGGDGPPSSRPAHYGLDGKETLERAFKQFKIGK